MKAEFIRSKIYIALILLLTLLTLGSMGYMIIEDYEFIDALYMTVITITTVGFKEANPLDFKGKIFTIALIFTSVGLYGYILSVITDYISNSNLIEELKIKKVQQKISRLTGHTIVCGYGRNGKQAISKMGFYKKKCVIIENDVEVFKEIEHLSNVLVVKGDATDDEVLIKAGIKGASSLIATLPSDAKNLYIVLSARQLNDKCKIVSRASNDSSYSKLKIAGARSVNK